MILLEPAVSLTDLGLAVENAAFAMWLARQPASHRTLQRWWILFFVSLALAALLGFVSHGFFVDKAVLLHRQVWGATLLSLGCMALAAAAVAASLLFNARSATRITWGAASLLVPYSVAVIVGYRDFGLAIVAYAPAMLFLLIAFVHRLRKEPARYWLPGIAGLVLTAIAAALQQLGVGLHPEYFNHNALYHTIQAFALWLLYATARATLRAAGLSRAGATRR